MSKLSENRAKITKILADIEQLPEDRYEIGKEEGRAEGRSEGKTIGYENALAKRTDLVVEENGTYEPQGDSTGFKSVKVAVPERVPNLQEKTATENGDVIPDDGYDGLSKVTVNVPQTGGSTGSHDTNHYVFDESDNVWYEVENLFNAKGDCPKCGCILSTNYYGQFETLCPCCGANLVYDNGNVTLSGETAETRIYAIIDGMEANGMSGTDAEQMSVTMDNGKRYYLEADGAVIGDAIYDTGNATQWSVGSVYVEGGTLYGVMDYGTISIYYIVGEDDAGGGDTDDGGGEWTCGTCGTGANEIGIPCYGCGKPCPF